MLCLKEICIVCSLCFRGWGHTRHSSFDSWKEGQCQSLYIGAKYSDFFKVTLTFRAYSNNLIFFKKTLIFQALENAFTNLYNIYCCADLPCLWHFLQYFNLRISNYFLQLFSILCTQCLFPISNHFVRASTKNSVCCVVTHTKHEILPGVFAFL